jgi:hypothetical protein
MFVHNLNLFEILVLASLVKEEELLFFNGVNHRPTKTLALHAEWLCKDKH